MRVELRREEQTAAPVVHPIVLVRGLDAKRQSTEERLGKVSGFDAVKASIRYPFDLAQSLNLGRNLDPRLRFHRRLSPGLNNCWRRLSPPGIPFEGERGYLERHYFFEEAAEIMPYRVYVPKAYDGGKAFPLIVALHGLGGTENTMLQQANGELQKLAEEHGYIVVAPLGYRRNGGYGRVGPVFPLDPTPRGWCGLSEQDVLNVLKIVRSDYQIDPARIYLMGHSMVGMARGPWGPGTPRSGRP